LVPSNCRKVPLAFSPSEMVDIEDALLPIEKALAKERQIAALNKGTRSGEFSGRGRARDHVAKIVGKDHTTIAKVNDSLRQALEA